MSSKEIDVEELVSLPIHFGTSVSWNRDKVAFFWNKTGRHELYIKNINTGELTQISRGQLPKSPKSYIVWSRDDRFLVLNVDKGGNEQHDIYAFDLKNNNEYRELITSDGQNYAGDFSPDNSKIVFMSTRGKQLNLYIYDFKDEGVKQLTDFENPVNNPQWDPDGEWIYFTTNESEDLRNQDIYRVKPDGTNLEKFLSIKEGSEDIIADIHDDNTAALVSDADGFTRPGLLDLESAEIEWLGDGKHDERALEFLSGEDLLLTRRFINAQWRPLVYNIKTGEVIEPDIPKGVASGQFIDREKILLNHNSPTHRTRMIISDITTGKFNIIKEAEYGSINRENFSDAEQVSYNSSDGMEIEAILYKPKSLKEGEKAPAIVYVHGGPKSHDNLSFHTYVQCLASSGFAILQPNYRGSYGYGKDFSDALIGDWGGMEAEDIARGAEYLRSLNWIDGERIAVAGGSYGGYSTYIQMVKYPHLWNAGVAWVGITDLLAMYEESMPHFKYFLRNYLGNPEENKELWMDRSAVTHVENFRGPLLMIHGINDPRCPVSQARIFRDKLLELGFEENEDFEYVELGEQGHGSADTEQRLRTFKLMHDFFKRKLMK